MTLNTYVNYGGNCEEALRYYEKHLGGKILMMMKFGDAPDQSQIPPNMKNAVLHARITIGDTFLMASDAPPDRYQPMRSAYLSIGVTSNGEAERIHAALSEGGEVFMPMAETFFAFRFSMLRDKFGADWMIIHEKPMGPA
jgi:PhnB protein